MTLLLVPFRALDLSPSDRLLVLGETVPTASGFYAPRRHAIALWRADSPRPHADAQRRRRPALRRPVVRKLVARPATSIAEIARCRDRELRRYLLR
jgi:hypothetical protein